ncbi:MAG TPA: hypothetical protein VLC98_10965 [Phnomibacter sp.]|nr:hypothetical protein [Phnomibacter sp.]
MINGEQPLFPYWAKLWPSAIALAKFISNNPQHVACKKVWEIAAGLGLPSLVAAPLAASVHCSDMSADAVDYAASSAALAGLHNMRCYTLNWNDISATETADTLLLSDVNYEPEVFETLLNLVQHFLKTGTTVLLASPQRLMAKAFIEQLLPFCKEQHSVEITDNTGLHFISVYVLSSLP